MARLASSILVALVSLLTATIYIRKDVLRLFYDNRPSRMPRINNLPNSNIQFQDLIRNCEDAYINHSEGWALLSCDPGRDKWNTVMGSWVNSTAPSSTGIYLYNYSSSFSSPPRKLHFTNPNLFPPDDFHPLGIEFSPESRTLYVVNHAYSGSRLELFTLDPQALTLTHTQTLKHDSLHTPNSIAVLSPTELLVTNDHFFARRKYGALAVVETYLNWPKGNVVYVRLTPSRTAGSATNMAEEVRIMTKVGFANGITTLNENGNGKGEKKRRVAVASSNNAAVKVFEIEREATSEGGGVKGLKLEREIKVPFVPDNLAEDDMGTLLIAGHPFPPAIVGVARARAKCDRENAVDGGRGAKEEEEAQEDDREVKAPSWIAEWTAEGGRRDLYAGKEFGSAVTAVRDVKRGFGLAVGLYERGVLTWRG